jgi:DNA/RNA-binding domain of Phe-tRNA-synthetase-like protein
MQFKYSDSVRQEFPELNTGLLHIDGVTKSGHAAVWIARYSDMAASRLANEPESAMPEIQAWRRAYGKMGYKPTQYRCASEALLRRYRKDGSLPALHPLVDLCNSISIALAIPIAVFDEEKITGTLEVRHAQGNERYETFRGDIEHPAAGEIIFADDDENAHARRWVNRQSGLSAVRDTTKTAFIVAEAMHESGSGDVSKVLDALRSSASEIWPNAAIT